MEKRPTISMAEAIRIGYPFDGSMNVRPDPKVIVTDLAKGDASFGTITRLSEAK